MKTRAAVLYEMGHPRPYADTQPLRVEEVEVAGPGPGQAMVEVAAAGLCHSDLQPGDNVVFSFVPMCGRCRYCAAGRPALCEPGNRANGAGVLLDGTCRFRDQDERALHHHLGVSAFSRFTIAAQESLIRIDRDIPLDRAALFGCAVLTGVGAVVNTARVEPGTAVAVFGLGGVGLSAVMGARVAGAYPIVAVDVVPSKLDLARRVGATHVVEARDDPVAAVRDLTGGGADYSFESVGSERVLAQAYEATRRGGTTVAIGLPDPSKPLVVPAVSLVAEERTVMGSYMGSAVPRRDIPRFLALYRAGLLPVDLLLSRTIRLDDINDAFDALARGDAVRQVVDTF